MFYDWLSLVCGITRFYRTKNGGETNVNMLQAERNSRVIHWQTGEKTDDKFQTGLDWKAMVRNTWQTGVWESGAI